MSETTENTSSNSKNTSSDAKHTSSTPASTSIIRESTLSNLKRTSRNSENTSAILYCLYTSHALSSWGDRMWEFALALLFIDIWSDSLFLVALYGLMSSGSVAIFGVTVGSLVDLLPRKKLVTSALIIQNASVFTTATGVIFLLHAANQSSSNNENSFQQNQNQNQNQDQNSILFYALVIGVNTLAAVDALANLALNVAIERDWVVVVAKEFQEEGLLTRINSGMRQIDLFCKLIAPAAVGLLMSLTSSLKAAVIITIWNASTAIVEYWLLMLVFRWLPALSLKGSSTNIDEYNSDSGNEELTSQKEEKDEENLIAEGVLDVECQDVPLKETTNSKKYDVGVIEKNPNEELERFKEKENREEDEESALLASSENNSVEISKIKRKEAILEIIQLKSALADVEGDEQNSSTWHFFWKRFFRIASQASNLAKDRVRDFAYGWKVYISQETILTGISLALLYFTVLSFDAMMTAELKWKGVPPSLLGLARGMAALTGLAGTILFPRFQQKIGNLRSGLWAVWMQWAFLVWCLIGAFFNGWSSSALLMGGVIGSRVGLWMFDLAAIQLIQESVDEGERGVVGGVQGSLQEFFSMMSYAGGILISNPENFWILVVVSFSMVTSSVLLFTYHVYIVRGHIFHLERRVCSG